jgi:glucose-6-phosphate isomerase
MIDRALHFDLRLAVHDGTPRGALFAPEAVSSVQRDVVNAAEHIENSRGGGPLAFLDLPYAYSREHGTTIFADTFWQTLDVINSAAREIRETGAQFVHLGIGGSALGALALVTALAPRAVVGRQRFVYVTDNVDPDGLFDTFQELDPDRLYANVVSKSGGTVETIATFAILWEKLRTESRLPVDELRRRVFVTTKPESGALAALARREHFTLLPLPDAVHGRFSVFSPMGLFTAAVAGVDVEMLLSGARAADRDSAREPFERNPSMQLAALHYLALQSGRIAELILFPYSDRLRLVADWYSQLVAESLGKQGQGLTPVKALGATDQHSQLQLYNDGPKNKLVVFFTVRVYDHELRIPQSIASSDAYAYLAGKSINELFEAERRATEVSLYLQGVPSCRFELQSVNAFSLGYLLTVLEKTVCILGYLSQVNAFDQPGVEESKEYARAMLGSSGERHDALRAVVARLSSN